MIRSGNSRRSASLWEDRMLPGLLVILPQPIAGSIRGQVDCLAAFWTTVAFRLPPIPFAVITFGPE